MNAERRVYVVDDDEAVRESTRGLLQRWGCRVMTADCEDTVLARLADPIAARSEPPCSVAEIDR